MPAIRCSCPVVEQFHPNPSPILREPQQAVACPTVTDDVGDPFPHRPRQDRIERLGKLFLKLLDGIRDPCCVEHLSRPIYFACQSWLPVARDGPADFAQRHPPDLFNLSQFLGAACRDLP